MLDDGDDMVNAALVLVGVAIVVAIVLIVYAGMTIPALNRSDDVPDAEWRLERVNETHVRISHAGGEPVDTEYLAVSVNGRRRSVSWSGTLVNGTGGVVQAKPDRVVRLYWTEGHDNRDLLSMWRSID